jgi:hypothetical protein
MRPNLLEKLTMSALAIAERLVGEEMLSRRVKRPEARQIVAREAGVAAGSLESLARGRLKNIDSLASKLNALRIRKLEEKLVTVQHELEVAKAMGALTQVDIDRAESAIKEAQQALGK